MKKILQPTNELFIQFSDDEVQELGLEQGQKFDVKLQDDGSVKLVPWVKMELEIEEWSKEILLMIIKESLDQDIPVNDVINNFLKEGLNLLEERESCCNNGCGCNSLESEFGLANNNNDLATAYNHYNVAGESDVLKYDKVELSTASHTYNIDPNFTNNDTSLTDSYAYKYAPERDMLFNPKKN